MYRGTRPIEQKIAWSSVDSPPRRDPAVEYPHPESLVTASQSERLNFRPCRISSDDSSVSSYVSRSARTMHSDDARSKSNQGEERQACALLVSLVGDRSIEQHELFALLSTFGQLKSFRQSDSVRGAGVYEFRSRAICSSRDEFAWQTCARMHHRYQAMSGSISIDLASRYY